MNVLSYIKKAFSILKFNIIYKNKFISPYFYIFNINRGDIPKLKKVLFYFNNAEFMHIGDHIFFIKTIKTLMLNGYEVDVSTIPSMRNIFEKIGIKVKANPNLKDYDLIISRVELLDEHLIDKPLVLVNLTKNLTMPIADDLLVHFSLLFELKPVENVEYNFEIFNDKSVIKRFNLNENDSYILLSPFCDSSFFLVTNEKINRIISFVRKEAKIKNAKILLIGSQIDKLKVKFSSDEFIDLRGKTTIEDILNLSNCPNVKTFIGFDNFIMHVFSIIKKPSFVVYRGRIGKKRREMIKKSHINLNNKEYFVTLI